MNLLDQVMKIKTDGLFLIVIGSSGSGKSHFIGTHPDPVLFLYGAGESHGPASALKSSKKLLPIAWDRKLVNGKPVDLAPDEVLPRLHKMLDPESIKQAGVKCVALDSITNLCLDIKKTSVFKQRCTSARGQHNSFKESEAMIEILSDIIRRLQTLVDYHDIDVITTLDLQIQALSNEGIILESKPGLPTFGVGRAIIQQFADILVLGRLGEKRIPTFQNFAKVASVSTDRDTQTMVKYIEYNPRLRGVKELPESLEASVPKILELKSNG